MYREIFASRIKNAREKNGLTQREVERETGIKQSSLAKYETGRNEPDIETVGILAEFYGISIDWLFGLGKQGRNPNYYEDLGIKDTNLKTEKAKKAI